MQSLVLIILIFGVAMNATAAPAEKWDYEIPRRATILLARVIEKRAIFCEGCLLWCRNRDLAEEFADIDVPFTTPPHPEDSLDFCSLRAKQIIARELASNLNEDDPEHQSIKSAIAPYVEARLCFENDYAAGYGKARDMSLFVDQVWSPQKLAALRPDMRVWVEKKLDERRRKKRPRGRDESSDNKFMPPSISRQTEQPPEKETFAFPNFAAGIGRLVPNLDAALRSIKAKDGPHQLGLSFGHLPPAFPVFAVP
ncbi:MAG: hypothetical protein M1816_006275 [Peltula sp. TS41687]|nr:MAG: hypothetical protein M1816_006275 [Peltula sp. TS41687]